MATENAATGPSVAIPAQIFVDSFNASNNMGCIIEQIIGVLEITVEGVKGKHEKSAIYGAITLAEAAMRECTTAQFSWRYGEMAREALELKES